MSNSGVAVSGVTVAMLAPSAVQASNEAFSDSNAILMTSAAIQDKIQSFNYSTTTGTVTSVAVTTGAGLDGAGTITSSGTIALSLDLSELTDMTAAVTGSVDELILLDNGAERRKRFAEIGLSAFSNDSNFTSNTGDITRVNAIAGDGLTGDSDTTSGIAQFTFDVGAGSGISVGSNSVAVDSTVMRNNSSQTLSGELNVTHNGGVTGSSAPTYTQANIELQTSSNYVPAISFHRGGYSATTLYEYSGQLYVNAWTTRAQTGLLLSTGNIGSYALTSSSTIDADTLNGASENVSASNSTIVQRHSSGYIFANYLNTTPDDVSSGITKICCETSNDGYIRHATSAGVKAFLGLTAGTFSRTIVRAYGSNSTYTPTSGTKSIQVYCVAGGGGGGNATGDDSGEQSDFGAASGGGGGGCAIGHYQLTGSFSASIQIGGGGGGGSGGGESRFTPSGSYTGNGTLDANGGGGAGSNASNGAGGGGASGGFNLTGHQGNNRSTSSSGGQYFQTPGNGGVAGFVFGTFGSGGNGAGPTGGNATGQSGTDGVVVVYEYINA